MEAIGSLEAIVVDSEDPEALAGFWAVMFGTRIVSREPRSRTTSIWLPWTASR